MNYKILIFTICSLVFCIIGASIWLGIAFKEDTVVPHPYEEALKYNVVKNK